MNVVNNVKKDWNKRELEVRPEEKRTHHPKQPLRVLPLFPCLTTTESERTLRHEVATPKKSEEMKRNLLEEMKVRRQAKTTKARVPSEEDYEDEDHEHDKSYRRTEAEEEEGHNRPQVGFQFVLGFLNFPGTRTSSHQHRRHEESCNYPWKGTIVFFVNNKPC